MKLPGVIESSTVNESRSPSTLTFSNDYLHELSEGVGEENSSLERTGTSCQLSYRVGLDTSLITAK